MSNIYPPLPRGTEMRSDPRDGEQLCSGRGEEECDGRDSCVYILQHVTILTLHYTTWAVTPSTDIVGLMS